MSLEQRVSSLERRVVLWRLASTCAFAGLAGAIMFGSAQDAKLPTINAREIRIVGASGTALMVLGLDSETDAPMIRLNDRRGETHASLGLEFADPDDGGGVAGILRLGTEDQPAIELGATSNGRVLRMYDLGGRQRAELKVAQYGTAQLVAAEMSMFDADEEPLVSLGITPAGRSRPANRSAPGDAGSSNARSMPFFRLNAHDSARINFQLWADGEPSMDLWGADGLSLLAVPSNR